MPDVDVWTLSRLLSTAGRLVEQAWNAKLRGIGLSYAAVIALDALEAAGPISPADLAKIIRVQAQTMGTALYRLEANSYLRREDHPSDRRSHIVTITSNGLTILNRRASWKILCSRIWN
ncbi:DNA-binding MarR family transcriptional regulator [Arthrobacter sp. 1088]|uniref:MarR family winged helix-turn-helix transcriptional regulator n=1 Tax=Arthrobacter sp. 1088 TaxID=2817768 RepID=UPI002854C74F|nr:MarR family transcriptional regulator [Arthrobacter sp. 1088]MDR6685404.1 DNA-binding MarR family transcriptional regulator [Arthrobacter sp. 1088]